MKRSLIEHDAQIAIVFLMHKFMEIVHPKEYHPCVKERIVITKRVGIILSFILISTIIHPYFVFAKQQNEKQSKHLVNVLVVGTDSRGEKHARSDSIMVMSYNKETHSLRLASIMRDSYVFIPTYTHKYNKINTAYFLGGPPLLKKTIQQNFGIPIHYYITVDFKGFIKIVDMLAPEGIEVDVPQVMIDDMHLKLSPGVQRLHGEQLLSYARFRHDKDNDFGRVQRQQEIISSLKDEVMNQFTSVDGIIQLTKITYELLNHVDTNMKVSTMLSLGSDFFFNGIQHIHSIRIPVQGSYSDRTYDYAGRVLDVDVKKNRQALKSFFEEEPSSLKTEQQKP